MADDLQAKQAYINQRLVDELVMWVATMRPDGRPHLVPLEFYWSGEHLYFSTDKRSRKVTNLRHNPYVALALPAGVDVVIVEGTAAFVDNGTAQYLYVPLAEKYQCEPRLDQAAYLVRVTPQQFFVWGGPYEHR
jgi:PPOX class probable F420-dependent enzyme